MPTLGRSQTAAYRVSSVSRESITTRCAPLRAARLTGIAITFCASVGLAHATSIEPDASISQIDCPVSIPSQRLSSRSAISG